MLTRRNPVAKWWHSLIYRPSSQSRMLAKKAVFDLQGASRTKIRFYFDDLRNWLAPQEYLAMLREIQEKDDPLFKKVTNTPVEVELLESKFVQPFLRTEICEGATLYAGPSNTKSKRLLVVFTGMAARMSMPTPSFLQHTDADEFDVLFFRDATQNYFRHGISGTDGSFNEVITVYDQLHRRKAYEAVYVLGSSAGSAAAIRFATLTNASRAIVAGALRWNDVRRIFQGRTTHFDAFDPICACMSKRDLPFYFAHSIKEPQFSDYAYHAASMIGGKTIDVRIDTNHTILGTLWKSDRLDEFYPQLLNRDFPHNLRNEKSWTLEEGGRLSFR